MAKHTILFLAANPFDMDRLELDEEARAIQDELERSGHRDVFDLVTRWAVRPLDVLRTLRRFKPTVVHFSGHCARRDVRRSTGHVRGVTGNARADDDERRDRARNSHGIFVQGADGRRQYVSATALERTFNAAGASVKLVVLSACYSEPQAVALLPHVGCVIGMRGEITPHCARSFAVGFYGGLGEWQSIAAAYRQGQAAMSLERCSDVNRPQLWARDGVAPEELVLADLDADARPHGGSPHAVADKANVAEQGPPPPQRWVHETTEDGRYTGREDLLRTLDRWADDPTTRTIAITGMGGLGKTALIAQWLKHHGGANRRPNRGLFFWSFYAESSTHMFLESFIKFAMIEVGVTDVADSDLSNRAIHVFNAVPLVVVLDGLELLQELPDSKQYGRITDVSLWRFLVAACSSPQCGLILLTSRFPFADLAPYIGRTFRIRTLERLTPTDGASLLQTSGVAGTSKARKDIAARLEGHPLALRIFAAALTTQTEGDPTRFWNLVFDQAKLKQGDRLEQKLGRLLAFYEQYLPPVRIVLMGIISMFRSAVEVATVLSLSRDLNATRAVVETLSDAELRSELFGIVEDGLLIRERDPQDLDLLTCHPLLRDHFRASLLRRDATAAGQVVAVLTDRPAAYVCTTLTEIEPILNAIDLLLADMDIKNAWALYRQRLESGRVLQRLLATTEGLRCALTFISTVARDTSPQDPSQINAFIAELHYHAGVFSALVGELTNAESYLDYASKAYSIEADKIAGGWQLFAEMLEQHADVLTSLGRLFDAARVARHSIAVCGGLNMFGITRRVHVRLAVILSILGQIPEAIKLFSYQQSHRLNMFDEEEFRVGLLHNDLKLKLGHTNEVYDNMRGLQMLFESRGWSIDLVRSYLFRARAAIELGRAQEAETLVAHAEELASNGHAFGILAELLLVRSTMERARGNFTTAVTAAEEVLQMAAPRQMRLYHIDALLNRARAMLAHTTKLADSGSNDVSRVIDDAQAALRLARGCGYIWAEHEALVLLADACHGDDTALAESLRVDALAVMRTLRVPTGRRSR